MIAVENRLGKALTPEVLAGYRQDFEADRANMVAMTAVTSAGLEQCARNGAADRQDAAVYSLELEQRGITSQKQSGRCWIFAGLNFMRYHMIHKIDLESFEFSQNYTAFYDKLEKANYFLENVLDTLSEPTDGRLLQYLLSGPVADGGQWDMFVSLIEKYGVVPKEAMPETVSSSATKALDANLTEKLRGFACTLREGFADGRPADELRGEKEEMMACVYRMLCICLSCPPTTFDFAYRDKSKKFCKLVGMDPQRFYKEIVGLDLTEYVSLINAPTADKPYNHTYTVRFLGNVVGGRPVRYLNLESGALKRAAIAQMQDGVPVWFGSDVGASSARTEGIMDLDAYRREDLFGTDFPMSKAQRLDYGQSCMTHAMVLMGVDLDDAGQPKKWRVENSWGKDVGKDGYFVMTDGWFDEYVYQVVVNKKYLTEAEQAAWQQEPAVLEPWDPMGSLA